LPAFSILRAISICLVIVIFSSCRVGDVRLGSFGCLPIMGNS
jgi:hypothetical protein